MAQNETRECFVSSSLAPFLNVLGAAFDKFQVQNGSFTVNYNVPSKKNENSIELGPLLFD